MADPIDDALGELAAHLTGLAGVGLRDPDRRRWLEALVIARADRRLLEQDGTDTRWGGVRRVAVERFRHVEEEGWSAHHDDEHDQGELAAAAACYADVAFRQARGLNPSTLPNMWPWSRQWFKPASEPIRNLEKAGALIAAELDRLLRAGD